MIRLWRIRLQFLIQKHLAQEEPIAQIAANDVAVLSLPANACAGRQMLFHHGCGINEHLHARVMLLTGPTRQLLQAGFQDVMIVRAVCA